MPTNELFLKDNTLITSKTDLKGKITYGNKDFIHYGGYKEEEFLNKPHSLVRHPQMPKTAFKLLWDYLKEKKEFFAFVCNLSKTGKTYWVFANVTPSYDEKDEVVGYYSVRRRPSKEGVETISKIYSKLLEIEKTQGVNQAIQFTLNFLKENNITWDEFIINLQNKGKTGGYR
ncbi:MAG: PAS domain-containing protein [Helicobacter sp.]|uniref:PAS domain-containing protein n=1 Tax=Helicobacter TaxID=209 RepID=UPI001F582920|nr:MULTISPECIES: PAS domain-containing protein [Helicobacter]MCI2236314.1 PAS domain-containing protein [Helicobacter sp. CaF467b]MCL9820498.1 PAS domain-containing protein [Helicobacter colisuis]MCL9822525.1 PAS domain-containing protein [Helicobacter colisuis]MDY4426885.1 PAS domain-containing protein [Helicobacter sp.]